VTLSKEAKTALIGEYHRHDGDTGSPEVQIAILTTSTASADQSRTTATMSHRGAIVEAGRPPRHLAYQRKDAKGYLALTDRLGIRRK
jgi:small subunit ribosomal protein S15